MAVLIVLGCLIVLLGVVLILVKRKKRPAKKVVKFSDPLVQVPPAEKYISPMNFDIGPVPMGDRYKSAGQCNDKVLYPVNGLEVNYGSKMPSDCPCTEFIQAP